MSDTAVKVFSLSLERKPWTNNSKQTSVPSWFRVRAKSESASEETVGVSNRFDTYLPVKYVDQARCIGCIPSRLSSSASNDQPHSQATSSSGWTTNDIPDNITKVVAQNNITATIMLTSLANLYYRNHPESLNLNVEEVLDDKQCGTIWISP